MLRPVQRHARDAAFQIHLHKLVVFDLFLLLLSQILFRIDRFDHYRLRGALFSAQISLFCDASTLLRAVCRLRKWPCAKSLHSSLFRYANYRMDNAFNSKDTVVAMEISRAAGDSGFPEARDWMMAPPIRFSADWQGKNADSFQQTEVRVLWSKETLHLKFHCRYQILTVFPDSDAKGRRDELWNRDVAEAFLQPDPSQPRRYWEFEIAPNGMWIDLEIAPEGKLDPNSGMKSRVARDESERLWTAELALPMASLTKKFDPSSPWRVNFFRVEGAAEPRFYSSWRPTNTPQPNFHVPEAFGILRFAVRA